MPSYAASATQQWLPDDLLEAVRREVLRPDVAPQRFLFVELDDDGRDRLLNGLLTNAHAAQPGAVLRPEDHTHTGLFEPLSAGQGSLDAETDRIETDARQLLEWAGSRAGFVISIDGMDELVFSGRIAVGRSLSANVVLRDPSVSRLHAWIERSPSGMLWLQDTGSKNGCFVNGQRLDSRTEIAPGDHLRFGRIDVLLCNSATLAAALQMDRG